MNPKEIRKRYMEPKITVPHTINVESEDLEYLFTRCEKLGEALRFYAGSGHTQIPILETGQRAKEALK